MLLGGFRGYWAAFGLDSGAGSRFYRGDMSMTRVRGGLTITQLAAQTGFGPDTIRYYERTGLLPAPARTAGDHRRYDDRAIDRLRFIPGAKRLGLRLGDIADLLTLRDTGTCPCEPAASLLGRRLAGGDGEGDRIQDIL